MSKLRGSMMKETQELKLKESIQKLCQMYHQKQQLFKIHVPIHLLLITNLERLALEGLHHLNELVTYIKEQRVQHNSNPLQILDSNLLKQTPKQKNIIIGELLKVWSIGPSKAQQLYNKGIRSIQDLRKNQQLLNKNQLIGLKYVEQFNQRIPREKVTRMFQFVKSIFFTIAKSEDLHIIQCVGSYRRGVQTCGDMDIIITRKDGYYEKKLLMQLVDQLQKKKFLTHSLTMPKPGQQHCSISYMGVCQFEDETHHRIDIKYYPRQQFAFAILYFTGSGSFNRSMRVFARQKGVMLSDHGFKRIQIDIQKQWNDQKPPTTIPICYTEKDIFKFLGIQYKEPHQRSF